MQQNATINHSIHDYIIGLKQVLSNIILGSSSSCGSRGCRLEEEKRVAEEQKAAAAAVVSEAARLEKVQGIVEEQKAAEAAVAAAEATRLNRYPSTPN
jgi:hypothetical protein